jgi:phosphoenolpyruvate synthase/pyruvate phosphate dikinase
MTKNIYRFGQGESQGDASMKNLLGGKGANLAEMAGAGLPVPPGFTISTEVCGRAAERGGELPEELRGELSESIAWLEKAMGARFGDPSNPLLVSVRSGAAVSMPGMMDTVLNLGLNDEVASALASDPPPCALGLGLVPSLRRDVRVGGDGGVARRLRRGHERPEEGARSRDGPRPRRRSAA